MKLPQGFWISILLLFATLTLRGQSLITIKGTRADRIALTTSWDHWLKAPSFVDLESSKNRGITAELLVLLTNQQNNFILASGASLSSSNIFSNVRNWSSQGMQKKSPAPASNTYQKNKVALTYIGIPLELRFKPVSRNKTFHFALGSKISYLLDAHTKTKWKNGNIEKRKIRDNFNPLRYGPYVRIGYWKFSVYAYYGLSPVFSIPHLPETTMLSAGLSFGGF